MVVGLFGVCCIHPRIQAMVWYLAPQGEISAGLSVCLTQRGTWRVIPHEGRPAAVFGQKRATVYPVIGVAKRRARPACRDSFAAADVDKCRRPVRCRYIKYLAGFIKRVCRAAPHRSGMKRKTANIQ